MHIELRWDPKQIGFVHSHYAHGIYKTKLSQEKLELYRNSISAYTKLLVLYRLFPFKPVCNISHPQIRLDRLKIAKIY